MQLTRTALRLNAASSAACGILLLALPDRLAPHVGLANAPVVLAVIGAGLLLFAGAVWTVARRGPTVRATQLVSALDVGWVLASVLVLAAFWADMTVAGRWAIALIADVVATWAVLQLAGLRRTHAVAR